MISRGVGSTRSSATNSIDIKASTCIDDTEGVEAVREILETKEGLAEELSL